MTGFVTACPTRSTVSELTGRKTTDQKPSTLKPVESSQRRELVNDAFRKGMVNANTEEQQLREWLDILSTEAPAQPQYRSRDIVRALMINHIQAGRASASAERFNKRMQWWMLALTVATIIIGIVAIK